MLNQSQLEKVIKNGNLNQINHVPQNTENNILNLMFFFQRGKHLYIQTYIYIYIYTYSLNSYYICCFCSVPKSCPTLCDPMICRRQGFPILHYSRICLNSCSLSPWCYLTISSSVTPFSFCFPIFPSVKVFSSEWILGVLGFLELQLQHQSFQWIVRVNFP